MRDAKLVAFCMFAYANPHMNFKLGGHINTTIEKCSVGGNVQPSGKYVEKRKICSFIKAPTPEASV